MESKDQLNSLLKRYTEGQCTAEEVRQLLAFFQLDNNEESLKAAIRSYFENGSSAVFGDEARETEILSAIHAALLANIAAGDKASEVNADLTEQAKVRTMWPRVAAVACMLIFCISAAYFFLRPEPKIAQVAEQNPENINPVNKGVTLTTGDGKRISLSYTHNGQITEMAHQKDNTIQYKNANKKDFTKINTLTNNSGTKFTVMLNDGTEAVLDVASSLTYPENFTTKEREVSMTGQVYFKVKHDARHPFRVKTGNQFVDDIGTEFNINAYTDETAVRTTLISGAVNVKVSNFSVALTPGKQAVLADKELKAIDANIEEATAWLQSKLIFHHETLENIMKRVARIYDVQVVWQDEILKKQTFGGSVSRSKSLATVLNFMRESGKVNFSVEGKVVKVLKIK